MYPSKKLRFMLVFLRHPAKTWRMLNPHSIGKFALSIFRHPSETWRRFRELARIATAPPLEQRVSCDALPEVEVVPVLTDRALQEKLVAMYRDNLSPDVRGPQTIAELQERLDRGIRFYLIRSSDGDFVGARAFDPAKKLLRNTVTDFHHRSKGYQLAAGDKLRELLAREGHTEFRSIVLRRNTRMQRALQASGFELHPDPNDPNLIHGILRLDL